MSQRLSNNTFSQLKNTIAASSLSLTVETGEGDLFPVLVGGDYFFVTLYERDNGIEINHEIMKVTARSGDVFTVERGQEGTTARSWAAETYVEVRITAKTVEYLDNIQIDSVTVNVSGTADINVATVADLTAVTSETTGDHTVGGNVSVTGSVTAGSVSLGSALAIAQGGTGATTAATARTNLDVYSKGEADTKFVDATGTVTLTGDVAGSASFSGDNVSITTTVQPNSVALGADTTGNYVATVAAGTGIAVTGADAEGATKTVAHADTSTQTSVDNTGNTVIQDITLDDFGHITALTSKEITDVTNATNAQNANVQLSSSNVNYPIVFTADATAGNKQLLVDDSGGTYNPSTNTGSFNISGNAGTATKWANARTVTLSGDVAGSVSLDGTANVTITTTVQPDSVALGTDTTGNYAGQVTAGTGIAVGGTAGEGTNFTVSHGDTSTQASIDNTGNTVIQDITLDDFGHITAMNSTTITTVTNANNLNVTTTSLNNSYPILFATTQATGNQAVLMDATGGTYNPSTNTATLSIAGNATTATTLQTARNISLSGDATGTISFNGGADVTIVTTVTDDSHLHDGRYYTEAESDARFANVTGDTFTGDVLYDAQTAWKVSSGDAAQQLADVVDDATNFGRMNWYGKDDAGATSNFRHAWYDGTTYLNVTASAGVISFGGNLQATRLIGSADTLTTARTISLTGDVTGSVSFNGSANVNIAATIAANSVALGTDTTGNYAGSVIAGSGISVSGAAGEGTTFTVSHADTSAVGNVDGSNGVVVQDVGFDTYGHVVSIGAVDLDARYYTEAESLSLFLGRANNVWHTSAEGQQRLYFASNSHTYIKSGSNIYLRTANNDIDNFTFDTSGNFTATGNVTAYSDDSLKSEWASVDPDFIANLANVKSGTYKRKDLEDRQAGVSANDMEKILPESVVYDEHGIRSLAYGQAAMVACVELAKRVEELTAQVKALRGE